MLEYSAFLENLAANKKLLFAAVALAALAVFSAVFWGAIGFVLLGFAYALAAIAGVIAVVLVWVSPNYHFDELMGAITTVTLASLVIYTGGIIHKP